jgi:protein-S-isoprenylcysteine O-methyltransferase Ste14
MFAETRSALPRSTEVTEEKIMRSSVRSGYLAFGTFAYLAFLSTILYAIGFVGNFWEVLGLHGSFWRSVDAGRSPTGLLEGLLVNGSLLGLFAAQHSVMARRGFKAFWARFVPAEIERSVYVLAASGCLALLYWQWRPIGTMPVWDISDTPLAVLLLVVSLCGWALLVVATFMIDHFELFGLRQTLSAFTGRAQPPLRFRTPGLYKAVRHPIYLGFLIAFWATPLMTVGHLVFALATTFYILLGIQLEERDLVHEHGDAYRAYREQVNMLLPLPPKIRNPDAASEAPAPSHR